MSVEEKYTDSHIEKTTTSDLKQDADDFVEFSPAEQRRITRKLDIRLVLTAGIIYCVSLMDRTNLSAANIAGMAGELRMNAENNGYSIVTLVFFVSYIIFQPPATVCTRKIGPRIFLPILTIGWGIVMIGMGLVNSWPQLAALRVILGIFEAGAFPGLVYLLSTWYTRYEMGKRYATFYIVGCVASAFAGILAYGLMQMNGVAGKSGWRWIFLIEGIITCVVGVFAYVFLVPFPDAGAEHSWGFLKKLEIDWVIRKVNADRGDVQLEPFTIGRFLRGGADWKIWCFALIFCFSTTVSYALAYFLPVILFYGMGFSIDKAQCLVAPPYVFAGCWMFASGWLGDKYKMRAPIIACNAVFQLMGLALMGYGTSSGAQYAGVFWVCAGANCNVPAVLTYQANNIRGQWKRAFCSASLVGFGGIGGIIGGLVFRPQDSPTYIPGIAACMTAAAGTLIISGVLTFYFIAQNRKANLGLLKIEDSEDFRYTY